MDPLARIRRQIERGELKKARRALVSFVREHRNSIPGWVLLASLTDDTVQQAEYWRHVLDLDPLNLEAAVALQRLEQTPHEPGATLRCPQCGGKLVAPSKSDRKANRATCWHCGTETDLPGAHRPQQGRDTNANQVLRRLRQLANEERAVPRSKGGKDRVKSDPATLERLRRQPSAAPRYQGTSQRDRDDGILSLHEAITAAGGPLPPEERRKCPECDATISRRARRCDWCGTWFSSP
jgi:predicted RNA-binding Zn-ribbon protein involved in translation (DUF1610 family)